MSMNKLSSESIQLEQSYEMSDLKKKELREVNNDNNSSTNSTINE